MLYVALIMSAVLFFVVSLAACSKTRPVRSTSVFCLGLSIFSPMCLMSVFPPVVVQAALICVVAFIWQYFAWSPSRFLYLSGGATVLAYALFVPTVVERHTSFARLAEQYPYESMEGRAPQLPPTTEQPPNYDRAALRDFEEELISGIDWHSRNRAAHLEILHERTVTSFVNTPGFGAGRMVRTEPNQRALAIGMRTEPAPLQPANPTYGSMDNTKSAKPTLEELTKLHGSGVLDFLHPAGFGYVKDRQHVAGFQSHGFSKIPLGWEVEVARLELVSLLMHKEPAVYLSERLPQMDALKGVPTRPLDTFESDGLAALRKGEDLYVREDRMLGSIRSIKQCIACHGGDRGVLLGAFSYSIRPAAK